MPRGGVTPKSRDALIALIDSDALIKRLQAFALGTTIKGKPVEMSSEQVRAAFGLLARTIPEVKQVLQDTNHNFNGDHSELATAAIIAEIQRRRAGTDADGARGRPN